MSLRRPRGEAWEKPQSADKFEADVRAAHSLARIGNRGYGCMCGQVFSILVRNHREAMMQLRLHQRAVIESMEFSRQGGDRYE